MTSEPSAVPVIELFAPVAIARFVQSPVVRWIVAADAVPPNVTAALMALFCGASAITGSSNRLLIGLENVLVTVSSVTAWLTVSVAPEMFVTVYVPSFEAVPLTMIEPFAKFVFVDHDTASVRRIVYVGGGGVHPLPLQVPGVTRNSAFVVTRVAVTWLASTRVIVSPTTPLSAM